MAVAVAVAVAVAAGAPLDVASPLEVVPETEARANWAEVLAVSWCSSVGNVGAAVDSGDLVEWFGVQLDAVCWSEEWLIEQHPEKKIPRRFNSSREDILRYWGIFPLSASYNLPAAAMTASAAETEGFEIYLCL